MSIQAKIDTLIKSVGSINIQDFVEISNFDKDSGFYNKPNIEKIDNLLFWISLFEIPTALAE